LFARRAPAEIGPIGDIHPQWLADYAHKNPGVYFFGTVKNIEQLKQDLGSIEWQRMLSTWLQ
jgi:hypothetical protein